MLSRPLSREPALQYDPLLLHLGDFEDESYVAFARSTDLFLPLFNGASRRFMYSIITSTTKFEFLGTPAAALIAQSVGDVACASPTL